MPLLHQALKWNRFQWVRWIWMSIHLVHSLHHSNMSSKCININKWYQIYLNEMAIKSKRDGKSHRPKSGASKVLNSMQPEYGWYRHIEPNKSASMWIAVIWLCDETKTKTHNSTHKMQRSTRTKYGGIKMWIQQNNRTMNNGTKIYKKINNSSNLVQESDQNQNES